MARNQKGNKNNNWRGGISSFRYRYKVAYKTRYPEKIIAHATVYRAVKRGTLIRQPCKICGNQSTTAHHEDYLKPLEVIWLCKIHHKACHLSPKTYCFTGQESGLET